MPVSERRLLAARGATARRVVAIFAAVVAVFGCEQDVASESQHPPIDQRIWRMIRCVECIDHERAKVVSMQDTAVPALRYLLLHGPPDTIVARYDSSLRTPRPATPPDTGMFSPPAATVDRRVQHLIAFYRIRSSVALGLIGTDSAFKALCAGKAMEFRDDVMRVIESSLNSFNGPCR